MKITRVVPEISVLRSDTDLLQCVKRNLAVRSAMVYKIQQNNRIYIALSDSFEFIGAI